MLYDDKSLYGTLRNDIGLVQKAVEEMLRYRFHISRRDRTVKQDNNLLGVELKKGDVVIAWMSASNMDENMYSDGHFPPTKNKELNCIWPNFHKVSLIFINEPQILFF